MSDKAIKKILAEKLKEFRKKSGLSPTEIGAAIGKSAATVTAWEREHGQPDADTLMKLCSLYGIESISVLFDGDGTDEGLPPDERELLSLYRKLNPPAQDTVHSVLRAFLGNPSMKRTP